MKKAGLTIAVVLFAILLFGRGPSGMDRIEGTDTFVGANPWKELGPQGGDIRAIVRNPKNTNELYAATFSGLIYRSGTNGTSWARRSAIGDNIYDLAINPRTPSTLYALGDYAIYKSVNNGVSFSEIPFPNYFYCWEGGISINPSNPQIIYVVGRAYYDTTNWKSCIAVLKSVNGGRSWTVKYLDRTSKWGYGHDVAVSPKNPSLVYACGYYTPASGNGNKAGIFRSSNGGETWKNVTPAFMTSPTYSYAYAIALDPTNAGRAYVAHDSGVVRTSNGGTTWKKQAFPGWMRCYAISIDKTAPQTLYAGDINIIYRSTDGGNNWTTLSNGLYGTASKIIALGKTIHVASNGGIFKSTNRGTLFAPGHKGILAGDITSFVRLPAGGGSLTGGTGILYAAAHGYGIFKSINGGGAWTKLCDFAGSDDIAHIVAPKSDPRRVYVSTYG